MSSGKGTDEGIGEDKAQASRVVLIAGCGRLGQAIGIQLASEGAHVYGLRRNPASLPRTITPLSADLMDLAGLTDSLPQDISWVYYIVSPQRFDEPSYRQAFVDGLSNLRDALIARGESPQRIIFVSSTGVYGQHEGEWIDETSPTQPQRFSGKLLLEAERLVAEAPWPSAIARLGGIYGPGRDMFIAKVRDGEACRPSGYTNRIHAADAAGMLIHLAHPNTPAGTYLGVDDEPSTQCQVMDFIAEQLALPAPPRDESGSGSSRGAGSKRGDNTKLKNSGYRLIYPTFREGYMALIFGH